MKKTVSVAPMMDCTDKHEIYFLSLISKNIHLYSEMIVANAIINGNRDKLLSFKKILPSSGIMTPDRILTKVDLPAPFSPRRA